MRNSVGGREVGDLQNATYSNDQIPTFPSFQYFFSLHLS